MLVYVWRRTRDAETGAAFPSPFFQKNCRPRGRRGCEVGGIVARAIWTAEDVGNRILVNARRFDLEPIETPSEMKTGLRLVTVREPGLKGRSLVRAQDAEIAEREILQILFCLAEIQIEQKTRIRACGAPGRHLPC